MKKLFLFTTFVLILFLTTKNQTYADNAPLYDVDGHQYETAIRDLYDKQIIQGYSDNTFKASNSINRAEFMKILIEATQDDFESKKSSYQRSCFSDVPENEWYTAYVCFARGKKIIDGYPDGTFRPSTNINLVEALKIIVNVFEMEKGDTGENWYDEYLYAMGNQKYIPSTFIKPSQTVNRGEMAEMIWRVLENKKNQDYTTPEDLISAAETESNSDCQPLGEDIPSNIDMNRVRETWLAWNNEVRADAGKYAYVYNNQLNRSSIAWSEYVKARGYMDHKRAGQTEYYDYSMITDWFADLGLTFKNNYGFTYTENIGWGVYSCSASDCTDEFIDAIYTTFEFYMNEKDKSYKPHYQSVMNDYFKEIGLGIAVDNGKYYLTVHYGTEITSEPLDVCI